MNLEDNPYPRKVITPFKGGKNFLLSSISQVDEIALVIDK